MGLKEILEEVSAERIRADVERITTEIPSRLAGTENGARMAAYSRDALAAAGLEAAVHEIPGLVSFPERSALQVTAPETWSTDAFTLGHSVPTPPEGIGGDLVDVASGGYEDYAGKDVTGRIVLCELSYHPGRHEKQRIAAEKGAIGCVMCNWGPPDSTALPFGSVKPAWGNPTPETVKTEMAVLPCVGVSRAVGMRLRALAGAGPVGVRFRANVEDAWRPVQVTVGRLAAGSDYVVVGGHQDSWFGPQVTDNAAGNACMMELARVFARHRADLRRGLLLGFWTAHETGTMVGSTWFVDRHWDELRRRAVAYLQIDQPSCAGTSRWGSVSNRELRRFQEAVDAEVVPERSRWWRPSTKVGDASFFGIGVPMFAGQGTFTPEELAATANANLGWWHHSVENTMDKIDWAYMQAHIRVYAAYVWELCTAAVLPFEFVSVAETMRDRLAELSAKAEGIGLDGAATAASALAEAAGRLDAETKRLDAAYRDGSISDPRPAETLNDCLKRLSRILVPVQSTARGTYGHDSYGLTAQSTTIPSLFDAPRLAGLPDGPDRWMLETGLRRARNRVADALADATVLIEETLARL